MITYPNEQSPQGDRGTVYIGSLDDLLSTLNTQGFSVASLSTVREMATAATTTRERVLYKDCPADDLRGYVVQVEQHPWPVDETTDGALVPTVYLFVGD